MEDGVLRDGLHSNLHLHRLPDLGHGRRKSLFLNFKQTSNDRGTSRTLKIIFSFADSAVELHQRAGQCARAGGTHDGQTRDEWRRIGEKRPEHRQRRLKGVDPLKT